MKVIRVGKRDGPSYHIDLGTKTRIGDMAAVRLWLAVWRQTYPNARLTVCFDTRMPAHCYSKSIPLEWALGPYIDEAWVVDSSGPGRSSALPGTELVNFTNRRSLKYCYLWKWWGIGGRRYAAQRSQTELTLPPKTLEAAWRRLEEMRVVSNFVAVQPLWDARYHLYRNAPKEWWGGLISALAVRDIPVVVLGAESVLSPLINTIPGTCRICGSAFDSIAISSLATTFVGGETGLPLWASMLGVPVAATLRHWRLGWPSGDDFRPLSFGEPVVHISLNSRPAEASNAVEAMFRGEVTESTPP